MSEHEDPLVLFMPSGRRGRFARGTSLLDAARSLGVYIESVCGGRGMCGRCQIQVVEGQFAKHAITSTAGHVTPFTDTEQRYADKQPLPTDRRLSCSALIEGDLVIDVPQDVQINRQVVRKRAEIRRIERDPATTLCYVEIGPPDIENRSAMRIDCWLHCPMNGNSKIPKLRFISCRRCRPFCAPAILP